MQSTVARRCAGYVRRSGVGYCKWPLDPADLSPYVRSSRLCPPETRIVAFFQDARASAPWEWNLRQWRRVLMKCQPKLNFEFSQSGCSRNISNVGRVVVSSDTVRLCYAMQAKHRPPGHGAFQEGRALLCKPSKGTT